MGARFYAMQPSYDLNPEAFDSRWLPHVRSSHVLDYQWLAAFSTISAREHTKFLENQVENPLFHTKDQDVVFDFDGERVYWQKLLYDIEKEEPHDIVRSAYTNKIFAQLQRIDMLEAATLGDDETFTQKSIEVYGKPKKKYFLYVAKRVQELLDEHHDTKHVEAHKRLKKIFSKIDTSSVTITRDLLPRPIESDDPITDASEVYEIFSAELKKYNIEDWDIEVDAEVRRRIFSISSTRKKIYIPATKFLLERKKKLTVLSVKALAEHEVGTHVVRSFNGSRQPLQLLGLGLQGYLRGEEGVASYKQQHIEGADEYYGFDRYMAASLVMGLDGSPRDFRGLFEILQDYYLVTLPQTDDVLLRAESGAWDTALRIFRGTTGQEIGCLFTRDIIYLEGNIGIWKLATTTPSLVPYFTVGKYDPLNDTHLEILRALDIIPV